MIYGSSVLSGIWLPSQTPTSVTEEGGRRGGRGDRAARRRGPLTPCLGGDGSMPVLQGRGEGNPISPGQACRELEEARLRLSRTFPRFFVSFKKKSCTGRGDRGATTWVKTVCSQKPPAWPRWLAPRPLPALMRYQPRPRPVPQWPPVFRQPTAGVVSPEQGAESGSSPWVLTWPKPERP